MGEMVLVGEQFVGLDYSSPFRKFRVGEVAESGIWGIFEMLSKEIHHLISREWIRKQKCLILNIIIIR